MHAVDLDLDVVQLADGTLFVDDQDEFEEHQVLYGDPAEMVAAAQASCAAVGHRWSALAAEVELAPIPDWAQGERG